MFFGQLAEAHGLCIGLFKVCARLAVTFQETLTNTASKISYCVLMAIAQQSICNYIAFVQHLQNERGRVAKESKISLHQAVCLD